MMSNLYLLSAPPASGKTYWISQNWSTISKRCLFLSPLRAICEEFEQAHQSSCDTFYLRSKKEVLTFLKSPPSKALCLMTVEVFMSTSQLWEQKFFRSFRGGLPCIFIDEFHLIKIWGDSFRPVLHEMLYFLSTQEVNIIGMSASLDCDCEQWVQTELKNGFSNLYWLDHGNMIFKHSPKRQYIFRWKQIFYFWLFLELVAAKYKGQAVLVFCRYRHEVYELCSFFRPFISTIGVVGGQTQGFSKKIQALRPRLIVGTSCLGHGVNLPILSSVFCNYREKNEALRLQMLSRGGRKGDEFITVELW